MILLLHLFQKMEEERIPEAEKQTLEKLWKIVAHSHTLNLPSSNASEELKLLFENSWILLMGLVSCFSFISCLSLVSPSQKL